VKRVAIVVLGVMTVACGPGFAPADRIDRTRIIDARAHAPGDPTRAWMLPGETATIEYLVVSETPTTDLLHTEFVGCEQASSSGVNGISGCVGPTFDAATGDVPSAMMPDFTRTLTVPPDIVPSYSTFVLGYLGACVAQPSRFLDLSFSDGLPTLDPLAPDVTCSGGARSELYRYLVQVVPDVRLANRNPNIRDERYYFGDVLWTAPLPSVPASGCASMPPSTSLPFVRMGPPSCDTHHHVCADGSPATSELSFSVSPDDREYYPAFDADGQPTMGHETIDVGHYITLGAIPSATHIDDTTGDTVSATWQWPRYGDPSTSTLAQLGYDVEHSGLSAGLLVRFWFVARDHRSGSDWVERDLCLTTR
jgi:hypothetical protein